MTKSSVFLTPVVRFLLSAADNMERAGEIMDNPQRKASYIDRLKEIEGKRENTIKAIITIDFLLAFLLSGSDIKIPGLDITLKQLPAALDVLAVLSVLAFLMLVHQMTIWQCYEGVVRQYAIMAAKSSHIDPDFIAAGDFSFDFGLKLYRRRFSIWSQDKYEAGKFYNLYSGFVLTVFMSSIISALCIHFVVIGYALVQMGGEGWLRFALAVWLCLVTTVSVLLAIYTSIPFEFTQLSNDQGPTSHLAPIVRTGAQS